MKEGRRGDLRRTTTCLVQALIGMGTTAMAWEAARARTATERVNFMIVNVLLRRGVFCREEMYAVGYGGEGMLFLVQKSEKKLE